MAPAPRVSLRALLLGTGPRFARDALGPVLVFYLGWRLVGLTAGLGAALGFGIALTQAVVGLLSGSAIAYFAPPVVINAIYGLAFIVSVLVRRPLAGVFAQETYPFPPEVRASATFRRVFSRVSLVWGVYLLLRSALRLQALAWGNVELFLAISVATGLPLTAALMTWSVWYGLRGFRRSEEWGWALRG